MSSNILQMNAIMNSLEEQQMQNNMYPETCHSKIILIVFVSMICKNKKIILFDWSAEKTPNCLSTWNRVVNVYKPRM